MNPQWQTYKDLELVPNSVPEPAAIHSILVTQLSEAWRALANLAAEKRSAETQIQHLEYCWSLNTELSGDRSSGIWRSIWTVLNRPLFAQSFTASSEPEIEQIADRTGQTWWCAYDPKTGQKAYLETEEDVQIWLEERFYP